MTRPEETTADDVLLDAVRLAMGVSVRAADQIGEPSPVQLRALTVLRENSGANLVQLAQAMGVTVSTASRLVDRLITARLATRTPSPETRREVRLALTRTGRSALKRYDRLRLDALHTCLGHLRREERESLIAALSALVEAVPAVRESPTPA
jgi:DNA-binding MarR family transcriptional regulator